MAKKKKEISSVNVSFDDAIGLSMSGLTPNKKAKPTKAKSAKSNSKKKG